MKRPFAILLSAVCTALAVHAQVPCKWTVDLARVTPADWDCLRGETVELMPSFVSGRDVRDLSGVESATLWWQTNGMGAAYWSAPASVDTNSRPHRLVARWTPEMDCGAASYRYFVGAAAPSGTQYRAHGTIRMRGAPGAEPNALPLPVQVLDFAKVSVTNAPWGESSGLTTNDVRAIVADATNGIPRGVTIGENRVTRLSESGTIYWMFYDDEAVPVVDIEHLEIPYDNLTDKPDFAEKSDLAGLVTSTNLPPLAASATVGDLVDRVNAVIGALHK